MTTGSELVAMSLRQHGVRDFFYIMGAPMLSVEKSCMAIGIRGIDVRHEQAAAMMAHSYGRLLNRPGVCMAASGPGTTNLVTGVANAHADSAPLVALGGSSPVGVYGRGGFQEVDQLAIMKPITRWAERVYDPARIPEYIACAFREASGVMGNPPGPVYLDLPGDILYGSADDALVQFPNPVEDRVRAMADPVAVDRAAALIRKASKPLIIAGSGVFWSDATEELQKFAEATNIPVLTTPQGRGAIPEDHELAPWQARSKAFRESDVLVVVGTRANYILSHLSESRFNSDARVVNINVDGLEMHRNRQPDVSLIGDAKRVLQQILDHFGEEPLEPAWADWVKALTSNHQERNIKNEEAMSTDAVPVHPLRLCKEVRDFAGRDAVLVVDGQEILTYGRQSIPTYTPRRRLNSGVFGTMGVGLPFGVGAKVAKPDAQVIVLHGDGSFGLAAMELDTAARHNIAIVVVISLNGGWTADPQGDKPGRYLGYTRFDEVAKTLGCHGEYVENPADIHGALQRATASGKPAVVNVRTDGNAQASTIPFTAYTT
ncbi:MAG: hypothetical protein GEV09_23750 [Pseudonocardiaceae bacterium]|nr:hypothetical protein [Pseudonocardiaceae bacterium]